MAGILVSKIAILVGMLVTTMLFGAVPMKIVDFASRRSSIRRFISLAMCYSGGVFLGACIMDLFPDVREAIDHVLDEIELRYHTKIDYPVAEFIILVGFFMILIVENTTTEIREQMKRDSDSLRVSVQAADSDVDERSPLMQDSRSRRRRRTGDSSQDVSSIDSADDGDGHDHDHGVPMEIFVHSTFRALLLLIALSFHSLFEGLAIGLQTVIGELFSVFMAVIMHKAVLAFALGLNIAQTNLDRWKKWLSVTVFSVASPLGMAVGIALTNVEASIGRDVANGVLQGIACGTFLYIALLEVLFPELNKPQQRMAKVLCAVLGFASICGLLFITH